MLAAVLLSHCAYSPQVTRAASRASTAHSTLNVPRHAAVRATVAEPVATRTTSEEVPRPAQTQDICSDGLHARLTTAVPPVRMRAWQLVPREVLFGNPEYASPSISPDGKLLAYLRPDERGVLNVWCRTVGATDDRVVTSDAYRGIRQFFWAEDSSTLLYMQDDAGDENFHLFKIDATQPAAVAKDLTPFPAAKAQNVIVRPACLDPFCRRLAAK
jgi:hypothetical protein